MLNLQPLPFLFFETKYHLYDPSGLVGMFVCRYRFPDGGMGGILELNFVFYIVSDLRK